MALTPDDFEGPYDLNPQGGPTDQTTPSTSTAGSVAPPVTGQIPWWSPANLLPTDVGQYVNYEAPTWGQLGQMATSRVGYVLDRAQRGIEERSNWENQQTDPATGQTYWTDPYSGNRLSKPFFTPKDEPRPDILTGMVGSVAEDFERGPFTYLAAPKASMIGSGVNELMQGFPSDRRRWVAGTAGLLSEGGWRNMLSGSGPIRHALAHMVGGHLAIPTYLAGTALDVPWEAIKAAGNLRNWARAYIAGQTAGVDRPSSQPGRTTNQLQPQD